MGIPGPDAKTRDLLLRRHATGVTVVLQRDRDGRYAISKRDTSTGAEVRRCVGFPEMADAQAHADAKAHPECSGGPGCDAEWVPASTSEGLGAAVAAAIPDVGKILADTGLGIEPLRARVDPYFARQTWWVSLATISGHLVALSPPLLRHLGYQAGDVPGLTMANTSPQADLLLLEQLQRKVAQAGRMNGLWTLRAKDGTLTAVEYVVQVVPGERLCVVGHRRVGGPYRPPMQSVG